jgi:hypothetical protein
MRERLWAINRPVESLDDSHPAKRFLRAFDECLGDCGGCELGPYDVPIDQEWTSAVDGEAWTFSAFVYKRLAFDVQLGGFLAGAPQQTESELWALEQLPRYRSLMEESAQAATQSNNVDCLELVNVVIPVLTLWDEYLEYRKAAIVESNEHPR